MSEATGEIWDRVSVPDAAGAVVRHVEGLRRAPYQDSAGVWTIGYGSTRGAGGVPVSPATPPIDEPTARAWQMRDMAGAAADVARFVTVPLLIREAAALMSFDYNEGPDQLGGSTLLRELNRGDKGSVSAQLRRWVYAGGEVLLGLVRRRWAEAAIFVGVDPRTALTRAWCEIEGVGDWPAFEAAS